MERGATETDNGMSLLYSPNSSFSTGIVVERRLCRGHIRSEEDLQEFPWIDILPSGGLHEAWQNAMGLESAF